MKKWLSWMTAALLLFGSSSAQTISPTTGLPIDGEPVAPMLVVISNTEANVEYNGHTTKAQGVGKRQAWGGRLVEAQWINRNGSIHYVDENGENIPLMRGKTYVAIWPDHPDISDEIVFK